MGKIKSVNKYSFVILSAGTGSRLGKIGSNTPKCLVQINKKKIIQNIIELLISIGAKEVFIGVGFKSQKIKEELKKFNKIKVIYYKINDFKKNGSVYTLYKFKNLWNKKKNIIMLHSDIIFDKKYLINILKSKKKNIIGVKKIGKTFRKEKSFMAKINKKFELNNIDYNCNLNNPYGEIICINKFSSKFFLQLLNFFRSKFSFGRNKETWEWLLSDFLQITNEKVFVLKNQNFRWINMNTFSDYVYAKKLFFK